MSVAEHAPKGGELRRVTYAGHLRWQAALDDLRGGLGNWPLWHLLAWQDIRQRYRRSTLGPFWVTLSMGVQMLVMGIVMSLLLDAGFHRVLPYVCTGLIGWSLVTLLVTDGPTAFIHVGHLILQMKQPLTIHVMRVVWRSTILFAHNLAIFLPVAAIYGIAPTWQLLLLLPALLLVVAALGWAVLLLAIVSTRFRDLPLITQNLLIVLFWATPILYRPTDLGAYAAFSAWNPLTHMLALIRAPLLAEPPDPLAWAVVLGVAVIGWALALPIFVRFRARVPYWL